MVAGDGFDGVRFVKNHHVVVGQNVDPLAAQREIAEEQRMIDDENLRVLHPATRGEVKTLPVRGTLAPHAVAAVAADFVPHTAVGGEVEVAQRTVIGRLRPLGDLLELAVLFVAVKDRQRALARRLQPP